MSHGHVHPTRPGEPSRATSLVRHRRTGRRGRLVAEVADGDASVLFDGESMPLRVPARKLEFLDAASGDGGTR